MLKVIKRNGEVVNFNKTKIRQAVIAAMKNGSGIYLPDIARLVGNDAERYVTKLDTAVTITQIEKYVCSRLIHYGQDQTALAYEGYRAKQEFKRESNTTDESILTLVRGTNEDVLKENSNKNGRLNSTQRDLVAGEVSKDIARRKLIPTHIVQAHDDGAIHYHDMDYAISPMFNCCLANIQDMLDNGTVINGRLVETPKSFQVACTVMTQIIAQVSSGQYGGQSMDVRHLGKYLRKSRDGYRNLLKDTIKDKFELEATVDELTRKELKGGVQTIQYQINTLMTTNGQAPFITLLLYVEEGHEYAEENKAIISEILRQRIEGIKNEAGVYTTPAFPKLIYILDENTVHGGKDYDVTQLAAKCSAKRLYPDYISAKKMREHYEGNVFSPMGCRSFLSPWKDENGEYKFEGRFNQGVVSLNLPQIAILADGDQELFWEVLEQRLELAKEALMVRHNLLKGTLSDSSPIHFQHGAIARLEKGETIDKLLHGGYSTISLGYVGLYETVKLLTGETHTKDSELSMAILNKLKSATETWKEETGLGFGLYGTPAESLAYRFARLDKARFGDIKDITDKGYYTNSYHVDVREEIDAFSKLTFESQFQKVSSGGAISYIEIPNMNHNVQALLEIIEFMYENIQYAEFNTKSDYCLECGFDQEITLNEELHWQCPQCGNTDEGKMSVTRRTCGYLGSSYWNKGKTAEIKDRVLHL